MKQHALGRVVIVGGGLAGLATAAALADTPLEIELYEARRQTGGRTGSFTAAGGGPAVDYCQHVAMGCCTNFLHLLHWAGLEGEFERYERLTFLAAEKPPSSFAPAPWLPPPLHFAPAFSRLHFLTPQERREVRRGLWRLMRMKRVAVDPSRDETFGHWLRRRGQSEPTIAKFWNVVLASALGDHVDRVAIAPARQVFVEGFLRAPGAADVLVPRQPLAELFGRRLPAQLAAAGVRITHGVRVRRCELESSGRFTVHSDAAPATPADDLVLATPWHALPRVLAGSSLAAAVPRLAAIGGFPGSAISGIHLWLDRPLTRLPHAVLIGRMSQWVFRDPCGVESDRDRERDPAAALPEEGYYYQVVVSAAAELRGRPRAAIEEEAVADLRALFPAAGPIRCLQSRVVTDPAAVFSVRPEVEAARPATETAQPGLYLAGDWVQTGWPATMEGAVLSGYRAAAAIRRRHGLPAAVVQPPLAASRLARCLIAP
ncbi:hydroxysqualene dehydroxylase HpnE [Candidatus Laterigemmans baculatus]|uniref:hydroxysqualene dehydroxylase HpnE n=1 Tax=Candidatus Laterigemmans baculatus TaxID=2770505 RepID=UPI0013DB620A|nr:hydroxysqualene dehydroxylase HpnE [Candidatus Laterigemmans baculatus]